MKRIILVLFSLLFTVFAFAQYSVEVGSYEYLELEPPKGWVRNAYWSCDTGLKLTEADEVGAIVHVTNYFSGSAYVKVSYTYEYFGSYDNNMHAGSGSKTYRITCIGGTSSISEDNLELSVGQSYTLTCERSNNYGTPTWISSNEDIVTINKKGKLTAISPGVATITWDPITAELCYCSVRVRAAAATSINIVPDHLEVIVGRTSTFAVEYTPNGASALLTWASENESIATVSSSGVVKGVSVGNATIVATTDNGLISRATVEVLGEPESISILEAMQIPQGYSNKLLPTVFPANCAVSYSWESSDPTIVTVDSFGNVFARKSGVAEITVRTQNNKSATCKITVITPDDGMDCHNVRVRVNALKSLYNDVK